MSLRSAGLTGWSLAFLLSVGLCLLLLALNLRHTELRPDTSWGLGYGLAGLGLMLGAMLYAARRRAPARGPGKTQGWLQFHIYGGGLFLLLMLMHTGFQLPTGKIDWLLWLLCIAVALSGAAGLLLQRWIPRILTSGLSLEVPFDRIGELVRELEARAQRLVEGGDASLRDFYDQDLARVMSRPRWRPIYFVDITGGIQSQIRRFRYLARILPETERDRLRDLEAVLDAKLELDAHFTLQQALRWWLMSHVPLSCLLLVLLGFHIFSVLYY